MAETLGEQYDPALPSALRQSSARKPLPASLPRETRVIRQEEDVSVNATIFNRYLPFSCPLRYFRY
ncbi:TPA: hypothetical protein ROS14_005006, partial [Escherichia coli]|nr:hypothetical protein [Escherichia coli]HDX5585445.1 hypothetical protein [Escherichia coli]